MPYNPSVVLTSRSTVLLSFVLLLSLLPECGTSADPADLILLNGTFWTGSPERQYATAVAVRRGRLVVVGNTDEAMSHRGPATEIIDLSGAFVVPGFNDNHVHFASAARFLEFNLMSVRSQDEFLERAREAVQGLEHGEWIVGGYWGAYDQWAEGSAGEKAADGFTPDMSLIHALTAGNPFFIQRFDSNSFAANTAALVAARVDPERPSAPGVVFERNARGKPTGILSGPGVGPLFASVVPTGFSHKRRLSQSRRALAEIRRHGVTSISDMSDREQLEIYRELRSRDELTVRVHFRPHLETWRALARQAIRVGSGDDWIRLGAVKGHIDGIMGTSSARFFEPYLHQPWNRGQWRRLVADEKGEFAEGKFLGYMQGADLAGLQLSVHAIGDEANALILDYLEELNRRNGEKDRRFRLVHAQVIREQDFQRLGRLGIVAEVQPFHLSDDMRWMEERIGHERCRGAYAFRRLREAGAVLSFGSDWPGTSAAQYPINPMLGLYAAVTRQSVTGQPAEGWFPQERVPMETALRAYTLGTAYGNFEENMKGTLEAGKLADLTVLSQNLFDISPPEILKTEVLYTIVGGRIVYRRE